MFRGIYRKRLVPQRAVLNFGRFLVLWWCQSIIITGGRYWSSGMINWHFFIDCQHTQGSIYALLITLLWQNYSYSITFLLYYDNKVIKRNYTIDSSLASFNQGDNYNLFYLSHWLGVVHRFRELFAACSGRHNFTGRLLYKLITER